MVSCFAHEHSEGLEVDVFRICLESHKTLGLLWIFKCTNTEKYLGRSEEAQKQRLERNRYFIESVVVSPFKIPGLYICIFKSELQI